mgnify:FL=1
MYPAGNSNQAIVAWAEQTAGASPPAAGERILHSPLQNESPTHTGILINVKDVFENKPRKGNTNIPRLSASPVVNETEASDLPGRNVS